MEVLRKDVRYTWEDYRNYPGDERWELIGGEAFAMTSPSSRHQIIATNLARDLGNFFRDHPCTPIVAPMDVKLSDEDVVQPDILVVCDSKKITATHIDGSPDLVIEILSPSTSLHDRKRKPFLYAQSGIQEYWIITPYPSMVEIFTLKDQAYSHAATFGATDTLTSGMFPELELKLSAIFDFPILPEERIELIKEGPPSDYHVRTKSQIRTERAPTA